jgi:cytidine deaminase
MHSIDTARTARLNGHTDADREIQALYDRAQDARLLAYSPYSGFTVGAALLTASGEVITGGNVENASYGLTICAERSALVRAVAEGHREFAAIAVAGDLDRVSTLPSCGACLQVLAEFDPDEKLIVVFPDDETLRQERLADLLPVRFRLRPNAG